MSSKDGLSAIANEVIGDVQKEAEAVIAKAQTEAKETLRQAKQQANQTYREIVNHAHLRAETEQRKIASVTEVDMRNLLLQTKEDMVDVAFAKALDRLREFAQTPKYNDYLLKLIATVAEKIGQKDLLVSVNAKDAALLTASELKRLSKQLNVELVLSKDRLDCVGGCIIQTADGKIIYDNTIDTKLEALKPTLRVEAAKILFKQEP
jgi:V/A-type H+-transporting ATPase subunit E